MRFLIHYRTCSIFSKSTLFPKLGSCFRLRALLTPLSVPFFRCDF